jgi:hypothetical protein
MLKVELLLKLKDITLKLLNLKVAVVRIPFVLVWVE